jgi:LysM repeat protein
MIAIIAGEPQSFGEGEPLKLVDDRELTVQFTGGSFVADPGDLRYSYRLRGGTTEQEKETLTTLEGGQDASYKDLKYGDYAFELWVQDNDGRRSEVRSYSFFVQASPVVTLTSVMDQEVAIGKVVTLTARSPRTVPLVMQWSDPDAGQAPPTIQAGWFSLPPPTVHIVRPDETLSSIAANYGRSLFDVIRYNQADIPDPNRIYPGQRVLIPTQEPPDTSCPPGLLQANCWATFTRSDVTGDQLTGQIDVLDVDGTYQLFVRARDVQDNVSLPSFPVGFDIVVRSRFVLPSWVGLLTGILIVVVAGYTLRGYPAYAERWGSAYGHPVQQLIPLVAPLNQPFDAARVQGTLRERQAFTTPDRTRQALDALTKIRILAPVEEDHYRFIDPLVARLHRWRQFRRIDTLAETVSSRHPLHAGARDFFDQAGFDIQELTPEILLLIPQGESHPQAAYGSIYTRLIPGRALEGDDFEAVAEGAKAQYRGKVAHRLAFVVIDRRPTPGARLRLYEIRQGSGLAIVSLGRELFGQVKPNMPARDILTAQIDQATGRQNLYAISGPVSDDLSFFGRETVLQQLIDLVDAGQPVGIFGLRKTGKTSLIHRLRGRLSTRRVVASVDTQGTAREQGVLPLYPVIIGAFVAHIQQYRAGLATSIPPLRLWPPPRGKAFPSDVIQVFFDDLIALHQLIGGDERLLLILDEVDRLLPAGDDPGYKGFTTFLGQLRAANQGLSILDYIVAGVDPAVNRRDKWEERDNEIYQALQEIWIPVMDAKSSREMVESMGSQMGIQYQPEALQRIVQAGGGQPFITRQICSVIVQDLLGQRTVNITADQAQMGIEEYVYLPNSYLTELWRVRLDDIGRQILLRLAQSDAPILRADLLPARERQAVLATLGDLQERTVIRRTPQGYVIGWGILRRWIRWIELGLDD